MVVRDLDAVPADDETRVWKLECDIDDATGEVLGALTGRLMETGAREAHYLPTLTKKGRPAWQLQVICTDGAREALELEIFRSMTTIGIRRVPFERTVLPRQEIALPCEPGPVAGCHGGMCRVGTPGQLAETATPQTQGAPRDRSGRTARLLLQTLLDAADAHVVRVPWDEKTAPRQA